MTALEQSHLTRRRRHRLCYCRARRPNKLKILIGFYMIATKVPVTYEVQLPNEVRGILNALSAVFTLGMQGVATTPLACLGRTGYVNELVVWMLFPPLAAGVVPAVVGLEPKFSAPAAAARKTTTFTMVATCVGTVSVSA